MITEKEMLLEEVKSKIQPSKGFILASYNKMRANTTASFRDKLVQGGNDFFALKKRIFLKAAKNLGLTYELSELKGHVGIVMVQQDFVSATKALYDFKKENDGAIEVLGGHFEGKKCNPAEVEYISKLPSLDVMRAEFLGLLEAPMSQTLATLEAILTSVIYCIDNKTKNETNEN